jgi:hypothetical protein
VSCAESAGRDALWRDTLERCEPREAVLREADNMAAELIGPLSAKESRRFLKALDAPFRPNANLKRALVRAAGA